MEEEGKYRCGGWSLGNWHDSCLERFDGYWVGGLYRKSNLLMSPRLRVNRFSNTKSKKRHRHERFPCGESLGRRNIRFSEVTRGGHFNSDLLG